MLTADLVRARRRGTKLLLTPLTGRWRDRALELAGDYLRIARAYVGQTREEFEQACRAVRAEGSERKLALGLLKLVTDRCEFEADEEEDPRELRRRVFTRAAAKRRSAEQTEAFDRQAVLAEVAQELGLAVDTLEQRLYTDLRSAHKLLSASPSSAEELVDAYELAQEQSVLLRALRVQAEIECRSPLTLRRLFHKLKFLRLLFTLHPVASVASERQALPPAAEAPRYRLELDGPASLYRASTRYGLQLALALDALRACDHYQLRADVLWGKERRPLQLELEGGQRASGEGEEAVALVEEARALLERFERRDSGWRAAPCSQVLHLPGVGLCVPDLVFHRGKNAPPVYLEILGFWSREAVWKRVELVERGLPERIVFAVSERLRVSERALGSEQPAALLVFKGVLQAGAVERALDALAARPDVAGDPDPDRPKPGDKRPRSKRKTS